jgi:hypothetical protein
VNGIFEIQKRRSQAGKREHTERSSDAHFLSGGRSVG